MALVATGIIISVGVAVMIVNENTPEAQARRQEAQAKRRAEIRERFEKMGEKRRFINKFIYEIPELSFYEATQLQQKLGDIYEEWNEE